MVAMVEMIVCQIRLPWCCIGARPAGSGDDGGDSLPVQTISSAAQGVRLVVAMVEVIVCQVDVLLLSCCRAAQVARFNSR